MCVVFSARLLFYIEFVTDFVMHSTFDNVQKRHCEKKAKNYMPPFLANQAMFGQFLFFKKIDNDMMDDNLNESKIYSPRRPL